MTSEQEAIVRHFINLCVFGEARFAPDAIRKVPLSSLPYRFRTWYSKVNSGDFYQLRKHRDVYALVYNNADAQGSDYKRICAVAAPGLPVSGSMASIVLAMGMQFGSDVRFGDDSELGYNDFDGKFRVNVVENNGSGLSFTVMQTSYYNDEDSARRKAAYDAARRKVAGQITDRNSK